MKSPPALLLGLVLLGLLFTPGNALVAKDYYAEQFDVSMIARPDGSLLVTETVVFQFVGGPFTYVFRELPTEYTDGITLINASMDDVEFAVGEGTGRLEVKGKDPIRVTWYFTPVSDSTHTFILSYRVLGVTQVEDKYDLLRWNAVPFKHDYPIQAGTVRITYPKRSKLAENPTATPKNVKVETSASQVEFRVKGLKEDKGLQVSLRFIRNSLISELPVWQKHRVATTQAIYRILPWALAVFALLLIAGIGFLFFYWEQNASIDRGQGSSPGTGARPVSPPSDLAPAFAGILAANNARPSWANALATLLDLARRGIVSIEEISNKKWFQRHDFKIHLQDQPQDLRSHERGLLKILFITKRRPLTSIKVSELHTTLPSRFKDFSDPLKQEMEAAGLLSGIRQAKGNRLLFAGSALLVAGLVAFILSLVLGSASISAENWTPLDLAAIALGMASGAILIGLSVIVVASLYSPLTEKGLQEAWNWRAYSEYLKDVTREREPVSRPDLFETALPYAASFGLAESWSRFFQKHGESQTPFWFQALSTSGDRDSMTAFISMVAASK